jgi:hypothetical protein
MPASQYCSYLCFRSVGYTSPEPIFGNVQGAEKSIPSGWESIPGLLERFRNTNSVGSNLKWRVSWKKAYPAAAVVSRLAAVFSSVASTAVELLDKDLENQFVFRFLSLDSGEQPVCKPSHVYCLVNRG